MKVLETAIVDYYNDNMSYTTLPKLYNTEAPVKAVYPYITFDQISGIPENALRRKKIEDFLYQFNIYSTDRPVEEVLDIFAALTETFDNCELTVTGYNFIDMDRNFSRKEKVQLKGQSIWQYIVQYRIKIND